MGVSEGYPPIVLALERREATCFGGVDGIIVYPVERVTAHVEGRDRGVAGQLSLW